uniref:F-box domain-containing protein n=1 Tax=Leersia perrieri TaxID=77586 RepID=A0A0D9VX56_9ORYZ
MFECDPDIYEGPVPVDVADAVGVTPHGRAEDVSRHVAASGGRRRLRGRAVSVQSHGQARGIASLAAVGEGHGWEWVHRPGSEGDEEAEQDSDVGALHGVFARTAANNDLLALPDDVLTDILRRLPPRSLAAARCVCAPWRFAIDSRCLLRADLLPLSLAGIFLWFDGLRFPEFFSRPLSTTPTRPAISGKLDYMPNKKMLYRILDHCNGLLLLTTHVVNPATRRCVTLPIPRSPRARDIFGRRYIVFDPTVSPHYDVIQIPSITRSMEQDPIMRESEWPPSPFAMLVFSSVSKKWEDRLFLREGEAAGTVGELARFSGENRAVYWHGALYLHAYRYVTRLSLSDGKYRVIKHPPGIDMSRRFTVYLGKSEKGVYLASLDHDLDYALSVWILNETLGKAEWVLKHQNTLKPLLQRREYSQQVHGPWILQDVNYDLYRSNFGGRWCLNVKYDDLSLEGNSEAPVADKFEWHSDDDDDDDVVDTQDGVEENNNNIRISILGFHPYREIIFLNLTCRRGLCYHLNSSKMEDLGSLFPKNYNEFTEQWGEFINDSFPYTPCWIGEFPEIPSEDHLYRN